MREKKPVQYKEAILDEAQKIYANFKQFSVGIRVLFLVHRSKEGAERANGDKMRKVITTNSTEFYEALKPLIKQKNESSETLRIYSSVNDRDMEKAIRKFKFDQLEADYYDDTSRFSFYTDVKNRFVSSLMSPSAKGTSYFLFDCDSEEETQASLKELAELHVHIVQSYPTKNGTHIITMPFNPNLFHTPNVDINKDGLLLLSY